MQYTLDTGSLQTQLSDILESVSFMMPEFCLACLLLVVVVLGLVFKRKTLWLFTVVVVSGLVFAMWLLYRRGLVEESFLLFGMLKPDPLATYCQWLICLSALVITLMSVNDVDRPENFRRGSLILTGEYNAVLLGLVLGAMLLSMSVHLLMIYLSIEMLSISAYVLTHFNFDQRSSEASIKYALYGGVASALMLYGMSLLYGLTGTLDITSAVFREGVAAAPTGLLMAGGILTAGGFLFKISSFPFHSWAPDVYEGAPTPVTALFSVVPKIAGFAVLIRYTAYFFSAASGEFPWQTLLAAIAILTIVAGNLAALWQQNAKRLMAYSSIAHAGFILIGVLSASEIGVFSVLFYLTVYALMNLGTFLLISMISQKQGVEIDQYKGFGLQHPFLGILMLVAMISLTGLPPTAGFTAKLLVFSALWDTYQNTGNDTLLLVFILGLLNTVISLFYYLKIPYYMFFKKNETVATSRSFTYNSSGKQQNLYHFHVFDKILVSVLIFPLLILFFKADWLTALISIISFKF